MKRVTRHYLPDVLPVYPAELTVASDGPAATFQWDRMGVFLKEDSRQYNNRPIYQKDGGGEYLHYNDLGYWSIGPTLGGAKGISSLQTGLLTPPVTGWRYSDNGWKEDLQLTVSGVLFVCYEELKLLAVCRPGKNGSMFKKPDLVTL